MRQNTEHGYSLILVVIGILLVSTISFMAWRLYSASQQKKVTHVANQPADANEGYIVIKEWGVRFKPAASLTEITYQVGVLPGSDITTAGFSTKELTKYGVSCSADPNGLLPLGRLDRGPKPEDHFGATNSTTKHIGAYYYQYITPQSACSTVKEANTLQTKLISAFSTSISTLEAAQ